MSEQETNFLKQLRRWIIGGLVSFLSLIFVSMFWFYTSANGRLLTLEKSQREKVNVTDFKNYQDYQKLKQTYLNESLVEIKQDLKDIKSKI